MPQADVLPHAAVLVCHGGSGTVLGGLAAGVPQVVVPFGADQPENAKRIAAIGAGLALINPEADVLAAAIQRVLANDAFRRAARAVAIDMATLPTVDDAVRTSSRLSTPNDWSADSNRGVDTMNEAAAAHGGQADLNPMEDHGFMYTRDFADRDGHMWAALWMDPAAMPAAAG